MENITATHAKFNYEFLTMLHFRSQTLLRESRYMQIKKLLLSCHSKL